MIFIYLIKFSFLNFLKFRIFLRCKKNRSIYYNSTNTGLSKNLLDKSMIFVGKYINRGPILIEKQYFECLGMYKDDIYFQGLDDIDLSLQICKTGREA